MEQHRVPALCLLYHRREPVHDFIPVLSRVRALWQVEAEHAYVGGGELLLNLQGPFELVHVPGEVVFYIYLAYGGAYGGYGYPRGRKPFLNLPELFIRKVRHIYIVYAPQLNMGHPEAAERRELFLEIGGVLVGKAAYNGLSVYVCHNDPPA